MVKKDVEAFVLRYTKLLLILLVVLIALMSFGKALDYNFWRDDWGVLWMAKFQPRHFILKWSLGGKHPGEFINTIPLIYLFDTNPKLWQLYGLLIKIIASFATGLILYVLTNSKKTFWITTLLFASYYGGLEVFTWHSAKLSAYLIILCGLGFYYYVLSYRESKSKLRKYLLFLSFLLIALLIEPGRAILIPVVFTIWELMTRFLEKKILRKSFIYRVFTMFTLGITVLSRTRFGRGLIAGSGASSLVGDTDKFQYFFNSIGNLLINTFISVKEQGGLASGDFQTQLISFVGIVFLVVLVVVSTILLFKRKPSGVVLALIAIWIPVFYFPGWSFEKTLVVGPSHRYLAVSSVGVVLLFSYLLLKLPKKAATLITCFLLLVNIIRSQNIVNKDYEIRGYDVTQPLYDKQEDDVPLGFSQGIFIVEGNNKLKGYAFDWAVSGTTTFALKRNIKKFEELPMKVSNYEHAAKLVCEKAVRRQYLNYWDEQPEPVPISKIYAWYINKQSEMINNTDNVRINIAHIAHCYHKKQNIKISPETELISSVHLEDVYDIEDQALSFNWRINDNDSKLYIFDFLIYNETGELISKKSSEINTGKDALNIQTNLYFSKILGDPSKVSVKIRKYQDVNQFSDSGYKVINL